MLLEIRELLAKYAYQTPEGERERLVERIMELKEQRNAVILAHNYQLPEIQAIADFLGDSLGLAQRAAEVDADVIVFCGVHFMAETAKLLNPERIVLLPAADAGCPLADTIVPADVEALKREHAGMPVVAYVNTTAAVKAASDVCCTSANAGRVVEAVSEDGAIMIPDGNLAAWTAHTTGRRVIGWRGLCPIHAAITSRMLQVARQERPGAVVMVHPECPLDVCLAADVVASTSGMVRAVAERDEEEFIVGTEWGLACRLMTEHPDRRFYVYAAALCSNMKKTTLPLVVRALETLEPRVEVPPEVADGARRAIERMMELS